MKNKILITLTVVILVIGIFVFSGCAKNENVENDNNPQQAVSNEEWSTQPIFGKKYYYLGYNGYTENEYYTFNENGTASYTHIIKDGENVSYHQEIYFKWILNGNGDYILVQNGTKMHKGTLDETFGFGRVMHVSSDVIYWTASGENSYFVNEDYVGQIEQYGKIVEND